MLIEKLKKYDIWLASGSPRRKQLLAEMDIPFKVHTKKVDEKFPSKLSPVAAAIFLSQLKSKAFRLDELHDNTLLITADTIVCVENKVLGKPHDKDEAIDILRKLAGNQHEVITGVCLRNKAVFHSFSATTHVHFSKLTETEILYYIDRYQPFDKAGAYGIQEWIGHAAIDKIEGSYFNVMGLPTHRLYKELEKFIALLES
jgi:septum formation protein